MAESDDPELQGPKPVFWVASSKKDLKMFPRGVRRTVGQALVVEDDDGKTYRAVYTVKFAGVVYVLHAFQKKSKSGIKAPPEEIEKVKSRLREAEKDYAEWTEQQKREDQDDH